MPNFSSIGPFKQKLQRGGGGGGGGSINKLPIANIKEKFRFLFQFSFYAAFSVLKKYVFAILIAINPNVWSLKTGKNVHQQFTFMKYDHVSDNH